MTQKMWIVDNDK